MTISLTEGSFSALIFDCDGTLVDTAPTHLRALQAALKPLDLTMSAEWYYPRGGLTPDDLFDEYEVMVGRPGLPRKEIMKRYGVAFQSLVPQIEEVAVIAEIAREWHGRVPMAVASNGERPHVVATLRVTKLFPLFDEVVAAEDVKQGKPAPDVFLEAARRMGVEAERCVVFEDSDEGLTAARAAGMRAVDIRGYFDPAR